MWLYDRYRVWKLKYHRWRFDVQYAAEHKKLLEKHADNQDFASLEADEQFTLGEIQDQIDLIRSSNLFRKAYDYDVELPPSTDQSMWQSTDDGEKTFLSKKGRAYVRKLIHEEYGRDFDLRYGSFTRIILPLIGLLTGLIGASAGYLAVKQRQLDHKNVPVQQQYFEPNDRE
jgi:hypothetical protein